MPKSAMHKNQKIPYMLVVGDKEMEQDQVALRLRGGENPGPVALEAFMERRARIEIGFMIINWGCGQSPHPKRS